MTRYMVDRVVAGRRLRLPTLARTRTEQRQRLTLFDRLIHEGLYDWIDALERGEVTWGDVLHASRQGTLHRPLAWLWLRKPVCDTLLTLPPEGQRRLRTWLTALDLPLTTPLAALAAQPWPELQARWPHSGAHWNHGRRALSRLLTLLLGKYHPERHQLLERIPLASEAPRHVTLPHDQVAGVIAQADPRDQQVLKALVLTGVRIGELADARLGSEGMTWPHFLQVYGTKTAQSYRVFPVGLLTASVLRNVQVPNLDTLRQRWVARRPLPLTLHDFRHLALQAAEACGIPEGHRRQWSGHAPPTVHARYTQAAWTVEDALTLERYWQARGLFGTPHSTPQSDSPPVATAA